MVVMASLCRTWYEVIVGVESNFREFGNGCNSGKDEMKVIQVVGYKGNEMGLSIKPRGVRIGSRGAAQEDRT